MQNSVKVNDVLKRVAKLVCCLVCGH